MLDIKNAWSPLTNRVFLVLWCATLFSNIGTWMQNAAAGWLMTELDPSPLMVSLVQASTVFPIFLFALAAGALADIVDRRKILIFTQLVLALLMGILGFLVHINYITATWLLVFTFLSGTGAALIAPSWQAIVPQLVPRQELTKAITLNGISMNLSRAIGPALTGVIIAVLGISYPFWFNAMSNFAIIIALIWWRPVREFQSKLPTERFFSSIKLGVRHARANMRLRASIIRGAGFLVFASCYWALLPLIANEQIKGGPAFYGFLLGMIGIGAIVGSFLLHELRSRFNTDQIVNIGTIGTSLALLLFGAAYHPLIGIIACFMAGFFWILVLPPLVTVAQLALADWVRGRGMAVYTTIQFGAMAVGSALWGQVASHINISNTHYLAAISILLTLFLQKKCKLHRDSDIDITPSEHWEVPHMAISIKNNEGPVLVMVQYAVLEQRRTDFIKDMKMIERQRKRTGAYFWKIFESVEQSNIFIEIFFVETWVEHLRQHERTIKHDLILRNRINGYLENAPATVTHYIARAR